MTWDEKALRLALAPRPPIRKVADGPKPLWIRYIGTSAVAAIQVSTNGDICFYHGATIGTVALDTGIGSGGIFDVSAATYNTFAKIKALLNASANWRGWLKDCLDSDSTNDTLVAHVYTSADSSLLKSKAGMSFASDTSVAKYITIAICMDSDMTNVLDGGNSPVDNDAVNLAVNKCVDAEMVCPSSTTSGYFYCYDGQDATANCWQKLSASTSAVQTLDPPSTIQATAGKKLIVRNHMGSTSGDNGWLQLMPETEV